MAMLVVADRAPAAAAVTAVLTATTPSYTGNCPTTMAFTGTISGSPGASFQYSFSRFVSGVQQVVNIGAATLPASGTLAVNDSMSINATTGGNTFDQLWVHNIAGQADVYSAKANIKVTCGTPPPPPTALPGGSKYLNPNSPQILIVDPDDTAGNPAHPTHITTSGDPKVCGAHISNPLIGGLLCGGIAKAGKLFIVWDWAPHPKCTSCPQDVDGFKIYQTNPAGTSLTFVDKTSAGAGATAGVLNLPAGGFLNKCYTVTAYKGSKESSPGHPTCINNEPKLGTTTVTLQSAHIRTSYVYHTTGKSSDIKDSYTDLRAGFSYDTTKGPIASMDSADNQALHGGVMFDLGPMVGRPLQKATLHLHANSSLVMVGAAVSHDPRSCGDELGTGTGAWWTNTSWIEATWVEPISGAPQSVDVDVTSMVRSWMNGAPNYGFVLRSQQENLNAFTEATCISYYDPPTLTVEYFK